jgi:hypothetical protein
MFKSTKFPKFITGITASAVFAAVASSVNAQVTTTFLGNGNSGFGGVIGTGNLVITNSADGSLNFTLNKGEGGFIDAIVIYIDSVSGGFTDTSSFNDQADSLRRAISGASEGTTGIDANSRSILTFNSGFTADYAIALNTGFGGLWELVSGGDNSLTFRSAVGLSPTEVSDSTSYTFATNVTNLGLSANSGESFKFVATYLNASNSYRSNEAIGFAISGGNPSNGGIGAYPNTIATSEATFTTIPEPSNYALLGLGAAFGLWQRRRKKA